MNTEKSLFKNPLIEPFTEVRLDRYVVKSNARFNNMIVATNDAVLKRGIEESLLDMSAYVWCDRKKTSTAVYFYYAASWWDMFKEAYFPAWLKKKFPVQYKEDKRVVSFERCFLYPDYNLLVDGKQTTVVIHDNIVQHSRST